VCPKLQLALGGALNLGMRWHKFRAELLGVIRFGCWGDGRVVVVDDRFELSIGALAHGVSSD
jgi:hypothetical protein